MILGKSEPIIACGPRRIGWDDFMTALESFEEQFNHITSGDDPYRVSIGQLARIQQLREAVQSTTSKNIGSAAITLQLSKCFNASDPRDKGLWMPWDDVSGALQ